MKPPGGFVLICLYDKTFLQEKQGLICTKAIPLFCRFGAAAPPAYLPCGRAILSL
ncbi:hypothetical protein HMPREF0262_00287 [Clostridium sp. ATCC 29733]|nr:hypothetical protein HMPREF0262_00287 [Clostridium sp. ATCC 29733]